MALAGRVGYTVKKVWDIPAGDGNVANLFLDIPQMLGVVFTMTSPSGFSYRFSDFDSRFTEYPK